MQEKNQYGKFGTLKSFLYIYIDITKYFVNYPQTKDLWASDFITDCPWKGLTSAPSV